MAGPSADGNDGLDPSQRSGANGDEAIRSHQSVAAGLLSGRALRFGIIALVAVLCAIALLIHSCQREAASPPELGLGSMRAVSEGVPDPVSGLAVSPGGLSR